MSASAAQGEGQRLFAGPCTFLTSVAEFTQLPSSKKPEIAFAGRSNVGKSSLINALTGRKTLAKTSNTPGRTQMLNFFRLGDAAFLVDMPGYGYAKAPKTQIAQWTALIEAYLQGRPNLRRVLLLIDARHGLKDGDEEFMRQLDRAAVSYQAVLTKTDKLKTGELAACSAAVEQLLRKHPAAFPELLTTSATTGEGIPALRMAVAAVLMA